MIFLSGFKSKDLLHVMDYIYQGEVKILQTDLDRFLNVAQQLKIEGLIGGNIDSDESNVEDNIKEEHSQTGLDSLERGEVIQKRIPKSEKLLEVVSNASNMESTAAVDDLVEKTENGWMCKACGKKSTSKSSSDIRRHAEIHIEGLSFDCQLCDRTFRSRNALKTHKSEQHRN